MFEVKAIQGLRVTARTAGMESRAKMRSVASMARMTSSKELNARRVPLA